MDFELLTTILLIYIIVELSFNPRIDVSKEGIWIWYGTRKRKCFKIY
jgi:hypothetical protein